MVRFTWCKKYCIFHLCVIWTQNASCFVRLHDSFNILPQSGLFFQEDHACNEVTQMTGQDRLSDCLKRYPCVHIKNRLGALVILKASKILNEISDQMIPISLCILGFDLHRSLPFWQLLKYRFRTALDNNWTFLCKRLSAFKSHTLLCDRSRRYVFSFCSWWFKGRLQLCILIYRFFYNNHNKSERGHPTDSTSSPFCFPPACKGGTFKFTVLEYIEHASTFYLMKKMFQTQTNSRRWYFHQPR